MKAKAMSRSTLVGSPVPVPVLLSTGGRRRTLKMSGNSNPMTILTRVLWGESLPPNLLVSSARTAWSGAWHLMMSQLAPSDPAGRYTRPTSPFRLDTASFPRPRPRHLHLYVGLPCPWAHRTLIVRALKGLHAAVPLSVAAPGPDGLWEFRPASASDTGVVAPGLDGANGCRTLKEVYNLRRGGYGGRSTVPMLWDAATNEVICNESYDIIDFFNSGLNEVAQNPGLDLAPPPYKHQIDSWNKIIYPNVNNGVYRCGFAQSQEAYDIAANELFATLEMVEEHLGGNRYLCGDALTLADVCLFTTLVRFDLVYNVLFKCTKKKLVEYQNLHGYMRDIYQISGVAETCNFGAIMDGYYKTLFPLNPSSIRPAIPAACERQALAKPHNRDLLSLNAVIS